MAKLFVFLYWPVVAILFRGLSVRLLRREIGLRWIAYGIVLPLWVLATAVFEESVQRLHQHGRLLGALGFVDGQSVNRWGMLLYFVLTAIALLLALAPVTRRLAEEKRTKKAEPVAEASAE